MKWSELHTMLITLLFAVAGAVIPLLPYGADAADVRSGGDIVTSLCAACHRVGLLGAPKIGDAADWSPRIATGRSTLVKHALEGFGQMPARGGDGSLTDAEVASAVAFMVGAVPKMTKASAPKAVASSPSRPRVMADAGAATKKSAKAPSSKAKPKNGATAGTAQTANATPPPAAMKRTAAANRFNRLMAPPSQWNVPPAEDGIHDPTNPGTLLLQHPREAFAGLPKSVSGNRVDWVKSLESGQIAPRFDRLDPERQPAVLDFNVVREVKGSMPDVVYPHKQHTEWLDCSNCHPAIFIPRKGANPISMASILMGQQCGVCHGKVAFPVSECRKCHSKNKEDLAGK